MLFGILLESFVKMFIWNGVCGGKVRTILPFIVSFFDYVNHEVNANGSIEFNLYCFFKQFICGFLSTICAKIHPRESLAQCQMEWIKYLLYIYVCVYKRWAQGFEGRAKPKWELGKDKGREKIWSCENGSFWFFGWRICQGIDLLIAFLEPFKMSKKTWG